MKWVSFISFLSILFLTTTFSQSNFNIDAYKQFLQSHQNMTTDELLQMYPAGIFAGDQNLALTDTRYLDSITIKYGLRCLKMLIFILLFH
jgi:hypothetical protein